MENSGTSDADDVLVTDTVDAALNVTGVTPALACAASAGNSVSCSFATIDPGETKTITVTYSVPATTDTQLVDNSATATSDEDSDTGSDSVQVNEDVQLSIDKAFADDSVTAGGAGTHTFTLVVSNDGASDADNVLVTDAVDPRLVVSDVSAPAGVDCSASAGQSVSCSKDHLASDGSFTITVTYDVASTVDSDPSVSNTADVASDEDAAQDTDTVAIVEDVQLSIDKAFSDDAVTAGGAGTHTFTLVVTNDGASDADNVLVTDAVDPRLVVSNVSAPAGVDCSASAGQSVSCSKDHLASGDAFTITVTYDVDSTEDSDPSVANTGEVASDEDSDDDTDTVAIVEDVQLSVDKSFTDDAVTAGGAGTHTFTLAVANDGASDADNVLVTDDVDARLVVSNVSAPAGVDCSASAGQSVSCSKDHLAAGGSFTITVTYDVDSTTDSDPSVANTGEVASDEDTDDDTDTVAITEDVQLTMDKSFTDDSVTAGGAGTHTFTLVVTNDGASDADGVSVTDAVDPRLVVSDVSAPAGVDCSASAGQLVSCSKDHLASGGSLRRSPSPTTWTPPPTPIPRCPTLRT